MENPKIEWLKSYQQKCLKFTFNEKLTEENAIVGVDKWKNCFSNYPNNKITLIWDCKSMSGYDPNARNYWQAAMKEMKNQIDTIWLITNSVLIRMGASAMSVFASFKIKVVSSEQEIEIN